jgi:MFS family permease
MIAGIVLPPLALIGGWPAALLLVTAALLGAVLAIQPLQPTLDLERDRSRAVSLGALLAPANLVLPFAALRLHPLLIPLTALCFVFAAANGCLWALLVSFLVEARGLTLEQAGLAAAAMQAGGAAARLGLGWLGDRTGGATRNLLVQAFVAAAALVLLASIPTGSPSLAFVLAAALAGATASSWQGIALAELARVTPPERVAEATAGASIFGFLGFAIGPAVGTAAITAVGDWTLPLLGVAALLTTAAAALAPRLRAMA